MSTLTAEYWLKYLRRHETQEDRDSIQKKTMKENATRTLHVSEREQKELRTALLHCSKETREFLAPLLSCPAAHRLLYSVLEEEKMKHKDTGNESVTTQFAQRLQQDTLLRQYLQDALDVVEEIAPHMKSSLHTVQKRAEEESSVEAIREQVNRRLRRTWKDIPHEELAERLSKGEIIIRDEWVPGLDKKKPRRTLNPHQLREHLAFGEKLQEEGNVAFRANNYALALTRYTQGVHLLNWVTGETADATQKVENLLLAFYKNQAAAALASQEFRTAQGAASAALALDEHDEKARFRRAEASLRLGELLSAKSDYLHLMKSPFGTPEGQAAGRAGLRKLRSIVTKWQTDTKTMVIRATQENVFSRESTCDIPVLAPCAEPSTQSNNSDDVNAPRCVEPKEELFFEQLEESSSTKQYPFIFITGDSSSTPPEGALASPVMTLDDTQETLEQLLDYYTNPEIENRLHQLRREADFDLKRIVIRAKKMLPEILDTFLQDSLVLPGTTTEEKQTALLHSVWYWKMRDNFTKELVEDLHQVFWGDLSD